MRKIERQSEEKYIGGLKKRKIGREREREMENKKDSVRERLRNRGEKKRM